MSDPTGNALRSAQEPDAREARLLALAEDWKTDITVDHLVKSKCAEQLLAALRGDA